MIFEITFATLLHMSHLFGVILAFGAVIATDVIHSLLLFKPKTAVWLKNLDPILSLLVWIGFLILSVTGLLLFLTHPVLIHDPLFRVKMIIVAVIFLNGVFLNLWVTPHFDKYAEEWGESERSKRFEKIAGAAALISATGWFLAFVLGYIIAN